jgi:hypothetical protein
MLLLGESRPAGSVRVRETLWRPVALQRYAQPAAALGAEKTDLAEAWLKGIGGGSKAQTSDRSLRTKFASFVFGATDENDHPLYQSGDTGSSSYKIKSQLIRNCIAHQQWNPCYLPQLADIGSVHIFTPQVRTDNTLLPLKVSEQVLGQKNALCIVLAPGIAEGKRRELLQNRKTAEVRLAVVDDVDLCRLLAPGEQVKPNPLIGLFEIAFEQQRWAGFEPFHVEDGQHVRMEMFVGRRVEATDLATKKQYSRVFSGRKLGKSALLRFIGETHDRQHLPSGVTLRVIYLSIVDKYSERDFVEAVLAAIKRELNWSCSLSASDPADRLVETFRAFCDENPAASLLLVLDEADNFVDAEIDRYRKDHERCITFRIRSAIESATDSMGHPRVRFVFSGYRTTNFNDGAWANWGDVLTLTPLDADDAAGLIAGPLARVGVDVSEQAHSIAYRCGYQPAVLLRLGRLLMESLVDRGRRSTASWEHTVVSADDVAAVFDDLRVQSEIRQVVNNNFTQNRVAKVIFYTVLLELSQAEFGSELEGAEDTVLDRLKSIDNDITSWFCTDESTAKEQIAAQLRELAQRHLLVATRRGATMSYRLKFPHHLSVLRPGDQLSSLQQEIGALRRGGKVADYRIATFSILSRNEAETFEYWLSQPTAELTPGALIVGAQWEAPVIHESGGVPAILDIERTASASQLDDNLWSTYERVAIIQATPEIAEQFLTRRRICGALPPPLFIGGADLLRWTLAKRVAESHEVASVRRMKSHDLSWWFEKVRGLDLPTSALEIVMQLTAGIPLLVGIMDHLLVGDSGGAVALSESEFGDRIEGFEAQLENAAKLLLGGDSSVRLDPRELELLRMFVCVGPVSNIYEDLTELWDLYRDRCGCEPLRETDWLPLAVLQGLGLLPIDSEKRITSPFDALASVKTDDPLNRIVQHLA